ncbi:hypothetical protein RMSM_03432 [Rhodopirellula maiorica SM1]|uniref:Uncharacterized protein n=1 Tax=Rhodopirellula maiorica SM1 TaxID=1265738 RepID=M5RW72_9BACT|nr:hypothetical protein RMSM_03432 [Rhodopirellula maiorica SM1]
MLGCNCAHIYRVAIISSNDQDLHFTTIDSSASPRSNVTTT